MKKWIVISLGVALAAVAGLALWSSPTPAEAQSPAIVGSGKCALCHRAVYDAWRQTWHANMVIDAKESPGANLGNWSSPKVGGYRFGDVKYMLGNKPGTKQYYVNSEGKRLPVGWDDKAKDWTGDSSSAPTEWIGYCAKCHTTGYDAKAKTFAEKGIACERCHGSGAAHINNGAPMDKTKALSVCSECHSKQPAAAKGTAHEFSPKLPEPMRADSCMKCRAPADVMFPPTRGPKANYQTATGAISTCSVCHAVHGGAAAGAPFELRKKDSEICTQCHTTDSGAPRVAGAAVHHPAKEVMEGVGGFGVSTPMPSPMAFVACQECHMPGGNHSWKAVMPSKATAKQPDSCTGCHGGARAAESLERVVETRQHDVQTLLASVKSKMDAVKPTLGKWEAGKGTTTAQKAFDEAFTNVSYVSVDLSKGFHNYPFSVALLKAADQRLGPNPPAAAAAALAPAAAGAPAPAGLPRTGDPLLASIVGLTAVTALSALGAGLALRRRRA